MWLLAFFILLLSQSLSLRTLSPTRQRLTKSNSISHVHTYRQSSSHNVLYSSSRCEKYSEFLNRGKRWGGPIFGSIIRQINTIVVGLLFGFILRIRNTFRSIRANILFDRIWNRPAEQGLVTVSNHKSFYDDPGLWAALLPWWRITNHRLRWSLCTEDVFFAVRYILIHLYIILHLY